MKKTKLETKREIAKIGMATSLFLTAGSTMFLKNKAARRLHIGAGIALIVDMPEEQVKEWLAESYEDSIDK